jgi:sulfoxide reductase heme-binding subunit YedZ
MQKHSLIIYFKLAVHIGSLLPLALLVGDLLNGSMINPIQDATQRTGRTAIALLTITLACSPLNIILPVRPVATLRKTLGYYTFLYASIHMLLYVGFDYGFTWSLLFISFTEQPYLWAALGTFLIISALAATSFNLVKKNLARIGNVFTN